MFLCVQISKAKIAKKKKRKKISASIILYLLLFNFIHGSKSLFNTHLFNIQYHNLKIS